MALSMQNIRQICTVIQRQVENCFPELTPKFIIHHKGQFLEALALMSHEFDDHPAAETARYISKKGPQVTGSSFMGLAIARKKLWGGLSSTESILGLFNINVDHYADAQEAQSHIYALVWHALDMLEVRQKPQFRKKFREGPMIPKRSALSLAKANLQADVFASTLCRLQGEADSIEILARRRAEESLVPMVKHRPEDYPFVIAMEATQFAFAELNKRPMPKSSYMEVAWNLSRDIGHTFDALSIQQWWDYSKPAQDMAWRDLSKGAVLGAAVNTSTDPYIKATAYLVAEISSVIPSSEEDLSLKYNAFLSSQDTQERHAELMDTMIEEVLILGLEAESSEPLWNAANEQNEGLTRGQIIGWCASALQAAAQAFEKALVTGSSPDVAARLEFAGTKEQTDWDSLSRLGRDVVDERRLGHPVTIGKIADMYGDDSGLSNVVKSISMTMKTPEYQQKLEAVQKMDVQPAGPKIAPVPATPAPTLSAQPAPEPVGPGFVPPAPGLGGNAASRQAAMRAHQINKERLKQKQSEDTTQQ